MTVATHTTLELAGSAVVVAKRRHRTGANLPPGSSTDGRNAATDLARQQTEAEARWLAAAARHQGVVRLRLVSLSRCRIETHHAGTTTLRTATLGPTAAAVVLATVAADLAELHRHGLVHGNLSPDHVILPAGRSIARTARPLLCSPSGMAHDPADELAGLADLVTALAAAWDHTSRTPSRSSRPPSTCRAWREAAAQLRHDRHRISARQASRMLSELGHRRWTTAVRRARSW